MKLTKKIVSICLLFTVVSSAFSQTAEIGKLSISGAYSRETVAGQTVGAGFLKIKNTGAADRLISASASIGAEVQLHTMTMESNIMKMSQIAAIDIPANGSVELTPGGMHLMIMGIKSPLKAGDTVKIKLRFTNAGEVEVNFPTQSITPATAHNHDNMKM
jgi:copper(I)-binding protein